MQSPQKDNQEPKIPNSTRPTPKTRKKRISLFRFGLPAILVFVGMMIVTAIAIRVVAGNMSHVNTLDEPISYVLNLADQHALKSVAINSDDIVATAKNGQQYHTVKEDGQSVTEIFRHDGVIVNIDTGQPNAWVQGYSMP